MPWTVSLGLVSLLALFMLAVFFFHGSTTALVSGKESVFEALKALVLSEVHRPTFDLMIKKESVVEYLTALALIPGIVAGGLAFRHRRRLPAKWLGPWCLLCAVALVYFAGEELSWGQHVLGFETPDAYKPINDQNETNLHNITGFLEFRWLIEPWAIFGCIIMPLVLAKRRRTGMMPPTKDAGDWFWPTLACLPAAALSVIVYLPSRISRIAMGDIPTHLRLSELQEFYYGAMLALYLVSIYVRVRQMPDPAATEQPVPASVAAVPAE